MKQLTDDELMLQMIDGRSEYIAEIFNRYKNELFGFFYRLTSKPDVSEDLVQNVFIRIIKYHRSYQDQSSFRSWLYRIARNVQVDYHQDRNVKMQIITEQIDDIAAPESELTYRLEHLENLEKALFALDEQKKELIILHRYQNLTYKEIAELYESNEGAIKVRMFRAMKELKHIFDEMERGEHG